MKHYLIAARYAEGLSATIDSHEELESAVAALAALSEIYTTVHDVHSALSNPAIAIGHRLDVLQDLLAKLDTPKVVSRLLAVMLNRGRIRLIPIVAEILSSLADQRMGRKRVKVCTATPMNPEQEARFAQKLNTYTGCEVRMDCSTDPEILGGAIATLDDTVIDGSIRTRLENMKKALLSEEH